VIVGLIVDLYVKTSSRLRSLGALQNYTKLL